MLTHANKDDTILIEYLEREFCVPKSVLNDFQQEVISDTFPEEKSITELFFLRVFRASSLTKVTLTFK